MTSLSTFLPLFPLSPPFFLFLCSLLPPQFPQEKPVVSVYPPVGHHLVDSNNGTMVTSPLITNVSPSQLGLRQQYKRQGKQNLW